MRIFHTPQDDLLKADMVRASNDLKFRKQKRIHHGRGKIILYGEGVEMFI